MKRLLATSFLVPGLASAAAGSSQGVAGLSADGGISGAGYLLQVSLGLVVVLGGIVALAWVLRRMGGFQHSAGGHLRVLEGLAIGPRERIVLLQCGEEQIVVGIAPGRVQTLHVLAEPVPVTEPGTAPAPAFARRLQEAMRRRGGEA